MVDKAKMGSSGLDVQQWRSRLGVSVMEVAFMVWVRWFELGLTLPYSRRRALTSPVLTFGTV